MKFPMRLQFKFISGLALLMLFQAAANGQMEKRECELYLTKEFAEAFPAVGSLAPEITLVDLDGQAVDLSSYRGKTIVVIKGGYT